MICKFNLDDEVYKLKTILEQKGWFFDSIVDLVDLYETFSEEVYFAGFMKIDERIVDEFIVWLEKESHRNIHYIY